MNAYLIAVTYWAEILQSLQAHIFTIWSFTSSWKITALDPTGPRLSRMTSRLEREWRSLPVAQTPKLPENWGIEILYMLV